MKQVDQKPDVIEAARKFARAEYGREVDKEIDDIVIEAQAQQLARFAAQLAGGSWVPVEVRLPDRRSMYWVTRSDGRIQKQGFDPHFQKLIKQGWDVEDVIAWWPYPQPTEPYRSPQQGGKNG